MSIRGVRGAVTCNDNQADSILLATQDLLLAILAANPDLQPEDIASIFFTMTPDLNAVHPALAARRMGWVQVPLLCAQEIPVPDSLPRCVRVLLHWNTRLPQAAIQHVYLGEAVSLRPDLEEVESSKAVL